jgi:alpha-L-fucosidase
VEATEQTTIGVLGHDGKTIEYMPDVDGTHRFTQQTAGLAISVVRAQRLYNNHKWPNPIVVKLENVVPAIAQPPYAETGEAVILSDGKLLIRGELRDLGGSDEVEVGVEYQTYLGFAEVMYNVDWTATSTHKMAAPGPFEVEISGLDLGTDYQYRVFVRHPRIVMRGDHRQVSTP